MKPEIRMIVSDMDGTMLNENTQISLRTVEAIRAAQQKGVIVAVCSGRFPQFVSHRMRENGLSCSIVGLNGAILWDDTLRKPSALFPMTASSALRVSEILNAHRAYYYVFSDQSIVTSSVDKPYPYAQWQDGVFIRAYNMFFDCGEKAVLHSLESRETLKYFIQLSQVEHPNVLKKQLQEIPDVYITSSGKNNIEIMHASVNKRFGVEMLAQQHQVPIECIMALGDYYNDIPMLRAAGLGVAMGNAADDVKACADYITDTNSNDGVAKAIEEFIL